MGWTQGIKLVQCRLCFPEDKCTHRFYKYKHWVYKNTLVALLLVTNANGRKTSILRKGLFWG